MKNIIKSFTVISACLAASAAFALGPDRLPIGSVQELRAYAGDSAVTFNIGASSSSLIQGSPTNNSYLWLAIPRTNGVFDPDEFAAFVAQQRLAFSLIYTQHLVTMYGYVYDKDNNLLFYTKEPPQKVLSASPSGSLTNLFDLMFDMNSEIWISIADAEWLQIIMTDAEGNPTDYYYPQGQRKVGNTLLVPFSAYYAGKYGRSVVGFKDGSQAAYGLNNRGLRLNTTPAEVAVGKVGFGGIMTFKNTNMVMMPVTQKDYDEHRAPIGRYANTNTYPISVFVSSWLPQDSEFASVVTIWKQGSSPKPSDVFPASQTFNGKKGAWLVIPPQSYYWIKPAYSSGFGVEENEFSRPHYWYGVSEKGN